MNSNETKQLKIKNSDWIRLDAFRLTLAQQRNLILTKIDTITLLLDEQLKNKGNDHGSKR